MTPTKEQVDAAKKWVLENIDAYGYEGTAEHVWLSDWLAEYAAHCTAEKDAEITRLRIELGYYADENRWRSSEVFMCGHSGPSAAVRDGGRRARAALQEPTP